MVSFNEGIYPTRFQEMKFRFAAEKGSTVSGPEFSLIPPCWRVAFGLLSRLLMDGVRYGWVVGAFAWSTAQAQWMEQQVTLQPGWNAVYLHVDASHVALDELMSSVGPGIGEVWQWQTSAALQPSAAGPETPTPGGTQWTSWSRSGLSTNTLFRLSGNAAYLVRNDTAHELVWTIMGRPVPPAYQWTLSGLNFIGFPSATNQTPTLDQVLGPVPDLQRNIEIYAYAGGALGPSNPALITSSLFRRTLAPRGRAFWMRSGADYNRYFSPVSVELENASGIRFSDSVGAVRIRLRNMTGTNVVVSMSMLGSLPAPNNQPAIVGIPPLLLRGGLNPQSGRYASTPFDGILQVTLGPSGSDDGTMEFVFGLNRTAMAGAAGSLYAGILRITDSLGLAQIDLPVTGTVPASSGLWVGEAEVSQVGQYLKSFERDAQGQPLLGPVTQSGASYRVSGTNTGWAGVKKSYKMRLILHNDGERGVATLLQRVFVGRRSAQVAVVTDEGLLDPGTLASARRISSAHFPFSHENRVWPQVNGRFQSGSNLVFNVVIGPDDSVSNPFLHTFHPDHDNLGSDFRTVQPEGRESYRVSRDISLGFLSPADDFNSLTSSSRAIGGRYGEVITLGSGPNARQFAVDGTFVLQRILPTPSLVTANP